MDLIFIVSRTEAGRYQYLKHLYADEGMDVVLDRRIGERRQSRMALEAERRRTERRRHPDVTAELQSSGWAVVRRSAK